MIPLFCSLGGWDVVNIDGDGTTWGINSNQFIKEKRLGNDGFYLIDLGFDPNALQYLLKVLHTHTRTRTHTHTHTHTHTVFFLLACICSSLID